MQISDALASTPTKLPDAVRHDDPPQGPFWVFAYGSLIWNPGFPHADRRPARVHGFHRRFCIQSTRYRGTAERPGLVLGLDRGGSCHGVAFLVAAEDAAATLAYLDAREIPEPVYRRSLLPARLSCGTQVAALTYVARRAHPAYRRLCPVTTAAMIAGGHGTMGSNREYLLRTLEGLQAAGLSDPALARLAARVRAA